MLSCHEYYTSLECSLASWPLNERYLFKLSKLKLPHKLSSGPTTQQYQHLLTIKVRRGPQMVSNPFKCDGWAAINKRGKPGYFTSGEDFFPVSLKLCESKGLHSRVPALPAWADRLLMLSSEGRVPHTKPNIPFTKHSPSLLS